MIRRLLEEAAELVRRSYEPSQVLLIEAPTGYGKSTSVPVLAEGLYENEYAFNFIHVLPLRAIVSDLYRKMYLRSFDGGAGKPLLRVREALERMGIGKDDVAYQMGMDALLKEVGGRKSPSFDARAVVSTLDSFAYNLLRVPVSDSFRATKRYAIVRARIFTSAVFFDEAHMILRYPDDEDAGRELAFMKALTEYARAARVPLIVSSATIGSWFEGKVREWSQEHVRIVKLGPRDEGGPGRTAIQVRDPDYEEEAKAIEWVTRLVSEGEVVLKARCLAECGLRVLVVRDRVSDAVSTYEGLRDHVPCVLLHGQLTIGDRGAAMERVDQLTSKGEGFVLVATPVVEAGVNWDFDAAFRDASNAFSLVQVVGRVCRARGGGCKGLVHVIKSEGASQRLVGWLEKVLNGGSAVDWRLPFDYEAGGRRVFGYHHLIEEYSSAHLGNLREDRRAYDRYRLLSFSAMPPSSYITDLVGGLMNYELLRKPLVHIIVGDPARDGVGGGSSADDVVNRSLSYDLSLVEKLADLGVVEGFTAVGVDDDGQLHYSFEREKQKFTPSIREYAYLYRKHASQLAKEGAYPILAGYVVKEEAYRSGVGFGV